MNNKNLLLLSSSRVGDSDYLSHALPLIAEHLRGIKEVLFIPYAGVTMSYEEYSAKVKSTLHSLPVKVKCITEHEDPVLALSNAEAVMVGGGNTFRLLERLYHFNLINVLQDKVAKGMPYVGWSAGSNIAGLSIKTTNDMPIIEPPSFNALSLVNFQLNPHYTEYQAPGHNGETREQRLAEFMILNRDTYIVGIEEGSALKVVDDKVQLVMGEKIQVNGYIFCNGVKTIINETDELTYLS